MAAKQVPGPSRTTEENATMRLWNTEALQSMRQELGRVEMDVVMIKKLEKVDIPSPANIGFLSHEQLQVVESETTHAEQMNKVIDYLLEKEDKNFEYFCQILEQSAFEARAKMLKDRAEEVKIHLDFKKSLEAALAKGRVEVEIVKCVTLGPSEAGKTQLKSALIGKFDRSSESTPMSTGAEAVVQRYVRGKSTWVPLTREKLLNSLNPTVKMFTESASPSPTEANSSTQKNEAQAAGVEPKKNKPLKTGMRKGTGGHEDTTDALGQRVDSKKALRSQFAAIRASVEVELKEADTAEAKSLDKIRIIHMVDSGGQPAFFDIHPVIATSRAVYLLVYNMEEGLDHKPAITYRKTALPTKQLQNTKQSNLDMIKDSLLTLHDCKQKFTALEKELRHWFGDSISEYADELPVLVVGTRKRKESIPSESEKLAKKCSYLPLWKKVLHSTDTSSKLFAVDSMDCDCQGVQSVRQEVDRAGCIFKLRLPVSWFLCQLIFLSVDDKLHVLTFSSLQDLCLQEGLNSNPDEFLAMVRTFHLLGIFSFPYLDQELILRDQWRPDDKPVFTNPDVLYQQVTKILEMAYRDLAKTSMEPRARESLTALQSSGRLDSDTLSYLGIPDDLGLYSGFHDYLLERLVHWGLAAKPTTKISEGVAVAGRDAFFIPSVLPACDKAPVTCSESTLSFTFCLSLPDNSKVNYVPLGIFPHLIVHIEGQGYEIQENTDYQSCLFRDVATFGIEPSHSNKMQYAYNVMVVDKMDRVTITIDPAQEDKSSNADCQRIVSDFKQAIETVYEGIYQVPLAVTEASECRCDKQPPSHLAMIIRCENGCYAIQCLLPGKKKRFECPQKIAALLCDQASPFSASQFLKAYKDEFVEVVHPKQILLELKYERVISADVKTSIEDANEKEAKYLLLEHLEKNATVGTLRKYCTVAIAAKGFPRMQKLGRKMINTLPPEEATPPTHPEGAAQTETNPTADTEADADGAGTKDRPPAKKHKPDHSKKDIDEPGSSADRRQAKKSKRDHSKKDTEEADTEDRPPAKKHKPDHSEKGKTKAFAVITANETEQKVVRHFLKLFKDAGEVWTDAENCDYINDVYLKQQRVKVKYMYTETVHGEYSYDFEVFTLSADEKQIIGIHVKCLQQAAETKGGSRNTTRILLKFADEQNWKLEVIFSVGCCMLSADKRSKNARKMMGHVLLSSEYEAFLERGKVEGRRGRRGRSRKGDKYEFMFHSQFYEGAREWVSRLQEHIITEPSKQGDLTTFRKIPVKEVPRFLCGPVVVKSADFGDAVRGNASIVGIEMEGSGIASALKDWKEDRETVPKFLLLKGVSDLGKGKGDDLEAMFFNEPTKEAVSDDVRQQIATFHCIALVVRGVAAHYLCTRRPSDGV